MAKGKSSSKVLFLEDEPEFHQWVIDFLESLKLQPTICRNVDEALASLAKTDYRLFLVDMNVPASDALLASWLVKQPLAKRFPGLILAHETRNRGYGAHSVIAYTVHNDDGIAAELARLYCRYVLKGRPEVLKGVIKASLAPPKQPVR